MKRTMLTYGCLLGALLVSSPLAARHTLRSGAAGRGFPRVQAARQRRGGDADRPCWNGGAVRPFRRTDSVALRRRADDRSARRGGDGAPACPLLRAKRIADLRPTALSGRAEGPEGGADGGLPRGAAPCGMDGSSSAGNDGRPLRMRQDRSRTLGFPVRGGR